MARASYRHVAEQRQHGPAQRAPALLVSVLAHAEEVVAHDGEHEHEQQQQGDDVDDPRPHRVQQGGDQHLWTTNCGQYSRRTATITSGHGAVVSILGGR